MSASVALDPVEPVDPEEPDEPEPEPVVLPDPEPELEPVPEVVPEPDPDPDPEVVPEPDPVPVPFTEVPEARSGLLPPRPLCFAPPHPAVARSSAIISRREAVAEARRRAI
jgi:periplasmic protein TonB